MGCAFIMGKIKVDQIEIESGNSIQLNNAVKIKSYDAAGISALTPASGDLIYDSDNSTLKVYTGSAWEPVGGASDPLEVDAINAATTNGPISLGSELKLKQYTTVQIDALSGVTEGEMVYDSTSSQIKVYNGTDFLAVVASAGVEASGGNSTQTYTDGGVEYKSHTFTSSGTFQVTSATSGSTVDVLLIAGGGAGGNDNAGGGGAGGMIVQAGLAVTQGNYSIVIGAGGARGGSSDGNGTAATSGDDTTGFGYTATGGGQGGSAGSANNAGSGGSGGGLQGAEQSGSAGTGISGQGNNGGTSNNSGGGGGGGGAGVAGSPSTSAVGGTGGNGSNNSYETGSDIAYAGGGAGGNENSNNSDVSGGNGGGGNSLGHNGTAESGTDGKGGGGAGGTHSGTRGGNGGSGIVIVRYTT